MADSLGDILSKKQMDEPPEIGIIKQFLQDKFQATAVVTVHPNQIVIGVSSAALAGTLRMYLHHLRQLCKTEKRLIIRID
jgi:hypothetical protein